MIDMAVKQDDNALAQIVSTSGLEQTKAQFILEKFQDYFAIAADWEAKARSLVVTNPSQVAEMKMAREGRLFLKGKRVEIEKARKELKEQSLREGKAIDGIANVLKGLIEPTEEYLEQQERFVELREEARRKELQEQRSSELVALGGDPSFYDLANMPDAAFDALLRSLKAEAERQKKEAEQAELDRIEREEEEKRIREENIRLRQEAEERERKAAAERAAAEAEAKRLRDEAAERERKLKADQEAKLKKERDERARVEAELKAKEEAEAQEKKRLADEAKKAARAPDKQKLEALAVRIGEITIPDMKTDEARKIASDVAGLLARVVVFINEKSKSL